MTGVTCVLSRQKLNPVTIESLLGRIKRQSQVRYDCDTTACVEATSYVSISCEQLVFLDVLNVSVAKYMYIWYSVFTSIALRYWSAMPTER